MDPSINRWLVLAFAVPMPVTHVIMGLGNLHKLTTVWPALLAMGICLLLVAIICWPSKNQTMPLPTAIGVVAGVVLMDVLVNGVLPTGTHPGYAAWHTGAIQMLLVAVTFRNRVRLAWLGMGLFAVLDFSASLRHQLSVVDALALILTPIMWMVIATAVQLMLGRSRRNIAVYTAQHNESAGRLAREHARRLSREQWLQDLEHAVRPALETIAAGELSDEQREDVALLEAQLRDQIRGRGLASPEVLRAGRKARERGVKVDLLDDRKSRLPQALQERVLVQLVEVLDSVAGGVVRARVLPLGEQPQVTILAFDERVPQEEIYVEIH